jgi:hypothetical protein
LKNTTKTIIDVTKRVIEFSKEYGTFMFCAFAVSSLTVFWWQIPYTINAVKFTGLYLVFWTMVYIIYVFIRDM